MFVPRFRDAVAIHNRHIRVKAQRDPNSYAGLERMLLSWATVMAFVLACSILLLTERGPAEEVVQFVLLAVALLGCAYALWRYLARVRSLTTPHSKVDRVVIDGAGYAYLTGAFVFALLSLAVLRNL